MNVIWNEQGLVLWNTGITFLYGTLVVGDPMIFHSWGDLVSGIYSKNITIPLPGLSFFIISCMPDPLRPKVSACSPLFHSLLFFHSCFLGRNKGISPIFNRLLGNVNPAESRRCINDDGSKTPGGQPSATTLPNPSRVRNILPNWPVIQAQL